MPQRFVGEDGTELWLASDGSFHNSQAEAFQVEAGDAFAARVERHLRSKTWSRGPGRTAAKKAITAFLVDEYLMGDNLDAAVAEMAETLKAEAAEEEARKEQIRKEKSERMKAMHAKRNGPTAVPSAPPPPPAA